MRVATYEHAKGGGTASELLTSIARSAMLPVQGLIAAPHLLFVATLALMLFHSPDAPVPPYDRFALGILVFVVLLRVCVLREGFHLGAPITAPLFSLLLLALSDVLMQPYKAETWSVFAAEWVVPFVLYVLAARIFDDEIGIREFEIFALLVFAYLSLTSIFFLIGAKALIFPRFILDESVGIHFDRARGPFLQAVANGVALNLLGLIALDSFRRRRLRGIFAAGLLAGFPLAILATKTRAVWLSFAVSIMALPFFCLNRRLRRACIGMIVCGAFGLLAFNAFTDHPRSLKERLEENGPVKFRTAIYQAGWEMFLKKPVRGWGAAAMQVELSRRIGDFQQEKYYFHNTYLEILVQYGLIGLGLFLWVVIDLFRVGRRAKGICSQHGSFLDEEFRSLWPVLVMVYLLNASFVVMNYQFVNGLLFTVAGMLNAQNQQAELSAS